MENDQTSTKKIIIKYGLILGLTWVIYGFIRYITDNRTSIGWEIVIIELFIYVTIIAYGIYKYKHANSGFLKLSQALKIGSGVALITAIIYNMWDIFLLKIISPETMYQMISSFEKSSITKPMEQDNIMSIENSFIFDISLANLIFHPVLGLLISLIAGAIMQKKQDVYKKN
ncbi:DUF4199 domain-containing protein [Aquimarina algiphila]|uniref:DUF4199 domain-containing protein n=1 Tax=Aquimarina algiphila TaxID=2047982 RepID=UPI0023310A89|nr:DUF4199 domain-containing protein [Aquimarina algiphila]